jgi:hypothetical protein
MYPKKKKKMKGEEKKKGEIKRNRMWERKKNPIVDSQ